MGDSPASHIWLLYNTPKWIGIQYNDKIQPESAVFWGSTDSNLASYSTDEEWSMVVPYLGLWVEPPTSQHSNLCGKVEVEGSLKSEMFDAQ